MKIDEITIDGKNVGSVEASDKIFNVKPRQDIIQQVIDWQQNRMFKKTGHTKSRGEVKGSRKKIVQQKGSGGARHGNITAPIFVPMRVKCATLSWHTLVSAFEDKTDLVKTEN